MEKQSSEEQPLALALPHSDDSHLCQLCGDHPDFLQAHILSHWTPIPGKIKCAVGKCSLTFASAGKLKKHRQQVHKRRASASFKCHRCKQQFKNVNDFKKHAKNQHKDVRPFQCGSCSFASKTKKALQNHTVKWHSCCPFDQCICDVQNVFRCFYGGCEKTFSVPSDLTLHTMQHSMVIKVCDVPGCLFTSNLQSAMNLHKIDVHSIWPHVCLLCGKGFNWLRELKLHMLRHENGGTHENPDREQCHLCGTFVKGKSLQVHMLKHKTHTPGVINCSFLECKRKFSSATALKKHMVQHLVVSEERPFTCHFPDCNKAYKSNSVLVEHKRKEHSSELWKCSLRGKQLDLASNVAAHIKRNRRNQPSAQDADPTGQGLDISVEQIVCKPEFGDADID
jgi:KRAB domain-containing zinc finger protein